MIMIKYLQKLWVFVWYFIVQANKMSQFSNYIQSKALLVCMLDDWLAKVGGVTFC